MSQVCTRLDTLIVSRFIKASRPTEEYVMPQLVCLLLFSDFIAFLRHYIVRIENQRVT